MIAMNIGIICDKICDPRSLKWANGSLGELNLITCQSFFFNGISSFYAEQNKNLDFIERVIHLQAIILRKIIFCGIFMSFVNWLLE